MSSAPPSRIRSFKSIARASVDRAPLHATPRRRGYRSLYRQRGCFFYIHRDETRYAGLIHGDPEQVIRLIRATFAQAQEVAA